MTPDHLLQKDLILQEALEVCRCIKHEGGILATPTLLHVRRMMEVYEGRPVEGKWKLWTEEQDTKSKIPKPSYHWEKAWDKEKLAQVEQKRLLKEEHDYHQRTMEK